MDTTSQKLTSAPLVSIIMLTYNRVTYIREAIESALTQTYKNFELIILDDGSTDTTASVVEQFLDPRIRYIKDTVNKGLYERRKESLSLVRGDYVAILDSDDVWIDSEKIAKQVAFMKNDSTCAVVGTFITLINEHSTKIKDYTYYTSDQDIRAHILERNQFANSSVLMRKKFLDKTAGYRDFAHCEDLELFLQLGSLGTFANLPEVMLHYRVHCGGESTRKVKVARQVLRSIGLHKNKYPGHFKAVLKASLLYVLATLRLV